MFHSTLNFQTKTWILTGLGLLILLAAVPALAQEQSGAQEIRALPAAASPPPEAADAEQTAQQKIPAPPGRAKRAQLIEKIRARPGGAERVDAARQGRAPGKVQSRSEPSTSNVMKTLGSLLVSDAQAAVRFQVDLTPRVTRPDGRHTGLYSSNHDGYALFWGAVINAWTPNNSYVRLDDSSLVALGLQVTNPTVFSSVTVPADGWYIVNINANTFGSNLRIYHWETGNYVLLAKPPPQVGWADYPMAQFLIAGTHYFYFVLPNGGYVSRISYYSWL